MINDQPHGDVEYADPESRRYPLTSPEFVRAAWSSIHQPTVSGRYGAEQLATIKSAIETRARALDLDLSVESPSSDAASALVVETRSAATVGDVDFGERIITVIAVPYEQMTPVPYQREIWNEVFTRSAFRGIETRQKRVPATACLDLPSDNHAGGRLVGRAQAFYPDRSEGLVTDLKISRTTAGDETLALANDGALDVSVGFAVKNRLDQTLDRATRTRRINRAFLDHVAFVATPAYTGAKVLAMRSDSDVIDDSASATPFLDQFIDDPVFNWANGRATS